MTTEVGVINKPKRRWFQFRLRTFLASIVLFGFAARWACEPIVNARRQTAAAKAIEVSGGHIYTCEGKPLLSDWMRKVFSFDLDPSDSHGGFSDLSRSVSHVGFSEDSGDRELTLLDDLPDLKNLMSCGSGATDAGMKHLSGLAALNQLNLSNTQITDFGLRYLSGLTNLGSINLSHTQIDDDGVECLAGLANLETLDLSATKIIGPGLQHLIGLSNLKTLRLSNMRINAAGSEQLKVMGQLRELWLDGTEVPIGAVEELRQALSNCNIIDIDLSQHGSDISRQAAADSHLISASK